MATAVNIAGSLLVLTALTLLLGAFLNKPKRWSLCESCGFWYSNSGDTTHIQPPKTSEPLSRGICPDCIEAQTKK